MDFNRAPDEEERLKALRRERFSNKEGEQRFKQMVDERAKRRQQLTSQGTLNNQSSLNEARKIVGTCTLMCPVFEREERQLKKGLVSQEVYPGTQQADPAKTVKTFHRSAAGNEEPLPEDLRTPDTLIQTLDYLVNSIIAQDQTLQSCHSFVRDRTRSIRQDFTIQNIRDHRTVAACERIARFHIVSLHILCGHKGFAEQQDMEQLRNTLKTLIELYDDHRNAGIACPNEPEFYAYYVVSHLRDSDAKRVAERLPSRIFLAPIVQQALKLHRLSESSDAVFTRQDPGNLFAAQNLGTQFFRAVASSQTPLLLACLAEYQFPSIRRAAIKAMNVAFPYQAGKEYPIDEFAAMLAFDSVEEVRAFCQLFNVSVNEQGVKLGERDGKRQLFVDPSQRPQRLQRNLRVVGAKFLSTPMHAINSNLDQRFLLPAGPMVTGSHIGLAPSTTAWPTQSTAISPRGRISNGQPASFASALSPVSAFGGSRQATPTAAALSFPKSAFPTAQPAESFAGSRTSIFSVPPVASVSKDAAPIFQTKQGDGARGEPSLDKPAASASLFSPAVNSGSGLFSFASGDAAQKKLGDASLAPAASNLFPASTAVPRLIGSNQASPAPKVSFAASATIIPPKPATEPTTSAIPPAPAVAIVWNRPRARINWTSLSNALYDDLLESLVVDVAKPVAQHAKMCAQVANTLIEDIADAIVNHTSAFVAYEESFRCVSLAQADSFRRKSLTRRVLRRWSMEAAIRQQNQALQQYYIDNLDELIDAEYSERHAYTRHIGPRQEGIGMAVWNTNSAQSQPMTENSAMSVVPPDFWESCHLGRDGFDAISRSLKRFGGPAFQALVDVSGTRDSSVLASWLWWQIDMSSLSSVHDASEQPYRTASYASGAQRLLIRELVDGNDGDEDSVAARLSSQIVLLTPEPLSHDDLSSDPGNTPLGAEVAIRVQEALDRARARPGSSSVSLPILFLIWSSDSKAGKLARKLVERFASDSGIPSFVVVNTLALTIASSRQQLTEGLKWVFKHIALAQRELLIRVSKAYETVGQALLQSLRRIYSFVLSLLGQYVSQSGSLAEIFNCAVDVVNAYFRVFNDYIIGTPKWGSYPRAPAEGVAMDYFCASRNRTLNGSSESTSNVHITDAIVSASIDEILCSETMGGTGQPSLGACLRALEFAVKHRLDAQHQTIAGDAYIDKFSAGEAAKDAALAADRLVKRAAELCRQGSCAGDLSLLASPKAKRPSSTAFSMSPPLVSLADVAHSIASTPGSMPSISGLTVHSATKRHRPITSLKLSKLQQAMARASEHLGQ
ncbi:actin cytoskeleton and mitosis protein [Coemansia aciculifera]|uniref:Actin cytoskeleton and mitosis protein n=1 Tax=Coemansia aciculifera TaxID=417176 RepID=A0ACC1M6Z5_9FUNG|nr:actin cytoskeleton and mitosis protein [Coemansia aciculifera]